MGSTFVWIRMKKGIAPRCVWITIGDITITTCQQLLLLLQLDDLH